MENDRVDKAPEQARRDLSALRINRDEYDEAKRPIARYIIVTLFLLAALGSIGAVSYRVLTSSAAVPEVTVSKATVDSGDGSYELLTATGYVVAHTKAAVGPKISGKLEYIGVDVGSVVKRDQIVGRLEHYDLDAQLADSKAALATAQANESQAEASEALATATLTQANATEHQTNLDYQRQTQLLKDGVAARSDFDNAEAKEKVSVAQIHQAEAQINSARAQVNSARSQIQSAEAKIREINTQLEYCNIRAPFDGIVISKDADLGEMVAPAIFGGTFTRGSVITEVDPSTLEVEADVNESNIIKVENGIPAEITLDAMPNKKFKAEAYQIVPTADRQKATVKVKVRFLDHDPRVLPDMSAKVAFMKRPEKSTGPSLPKISAPKSAVVQRDGQTVVFVLSDQRVKVQPVKTGDDLGDHVEIKEGLAGGETLLVSGTDNLKDGDRVRVKT